MSDPKDFIIENGVLTEYTGPGGDVAIPDGVTTIGDCAFLDCCSMESVTIPKSVTAIKDCAFFDCCGLKSITIPHGVTIIEEFTFYGCISLTSVVIPDGVTAIGGDAFFNCGSLESVVIPRSVTKISAWAFDNCSSLKNITIPEGMTTIEYSVFSGCSSLESVIIPESVTAIGDCAFYNCSSLKSITIPESVTSIGACTFEGCSSLAGITIPAGVTEIGRHAFSGCTNLRELRMDPHRKITKDIFGRKLPSGLLSHLADLAPLFTERIFKKYVLIQDVWAALPPEQQAAFFLARQGKALLPAYQQCIQDPDAMGKVLLSQLAGKPFVKLCSATANFMMLFSGTIDPELLRQLWEALKPLKAAAKALQAIEADKALMEILQE